MAIALNPGAGAGVIGTLAPPGCVVEFSDATEIYPALGTLQQGSPYSWGTEYVTGFVTDNRTGSPTQGQTIPYGANFPTTAYNMSPVGQNFVAKTLEISCNSGLKKHRLFAYNLLNPVGYYGQYVLQYFQGTVGGTYTNPTPPSSMGYIPNGIYSSVFLGSLAGQVTCWLGGQQVGKIPFSIFAPLGASSAISQIFDASLGVGTIAALKGGGLTVLTPFDGTGRNLPVVEFCGNCDRVTFDFSIAGAFCSGGGFYAGVLSYD